jgi:hypothetical protein
MQLFRSRLDFVRSNVSQRGKQAHGCWILRVEELLCREKEETHEICLYWKTPWNAHDFLVQAVLVRLAHYFPEMRIWSEESAPHGMWEGVVLCKEVFGVGIDPNETGNDGLDRQ